MLDVFMARRMQGHRTMKYPDGPLPELSARFAGLPVVGQGICPPDCGRCADACPTNAVTCVPRLSVDLGKCLFCRECVSACQEGILTFSRDHRMAASRREDLIVGAEGFKAAGSLEEARRKLFGKSLKLRQVSAGGCNACEADTNVLGTLAWDLGRFGIQFVASPRHADGILVTGPVPENMREALLKTWAAVPEPRVAIVVGSCAISGGPYAGLPEVHNGATGFIPVDLLVPGCPPHPLTILDGLLRLIGRIS